MSDRPRLGPFSGPDPPGGSGEDRASVGREGDGDPSGNRKGTGGSPVGDALTEEGEPRNGPRIWSVSEVNRAVRILLERQLPPIWVSGEVANWARARSGHCYFTLKDDQAQLRCVMWRTEAERLPTDPEDGMRLRAFGYLTLYEARGEFQLVVRRLQDEAGEGLWRLALERLRRKLEQEGLLAPERKRPLPPFPEGVGVVTSPTGAALHDILTVLRRRAPWVRVVLRGARVQGEGAALELADALRALGESGLVQVVVIGRGGGSIEDLWAFNEEPVARAIASCPVPVISAVGHEVDVTIADLVADVRAPTPSAAAESVVPDRNAVLERVRGSVPTMLHGLRGSVRRRRVLLDQGRQRLARCVRRKVERRRDRLAALAGQLEALSPLATMKRGYAVPLGPGGSLLRQVRDFPRGLRFTLRVVDGRIGCGVLDHETEDTTGA